MIFEQNDEEYYVYFYDFNGNNEEDDLSSLISSNIEGKIYKVDTGSGLNSKYVTDENGEASTKVIGGLPYDTYAVREENGKIFF